MTNQEPRYLFQGVNYLGLLSKQLGDLRGMPTLAHELIQNADDAKNESGKLSATRVTFDVRDNALVVSNDATFREIDFERMQYVASGSKRSELGDRTTGTFGVGFISVYQITDRPEIRSAGRRWILRPDKGEDRRIKVRMDPSITKDKGTVFKLPWAFEDSRVRQELKVSTVSRNSIDIFIDELKGSLPKALLFLKKITSIDLYRNGNLVMRTTIARENNTHRVLRHEAERLYKMIEGDFKDEAAILRNRHPSIEENRSCVVQIAVPDSDLSDGLLFATLPTKQKTGLPFHINADFFPASDRKSIAFENSYDYRSEWNRAAIRAAASAIRDNLIFLRELFSNDASRLWAMLEQLRRVYDEHKEGTCQPFAAFWESIAPLLPQAPIVYVRSARLPKWLSPPNTRIPTGRDEEQAAAAFQALGIDMVHKDLYRYRNILTSVGVRTLSTQDIHDRLRVRKLVDQPQPYPSDLHDRERLKLLWDGCGAVLSNSRRQSSRQSDRELLGRCVLAPGLDQRLWPCDSAYQADSETRQIFDSLVPDDRTFLAATDIPLLKRICPTFALTTAIEWLERLPNDQVQAAWSNGQFDPSEILHWFDYRKRHLTSDLRDRLASLPIYPTANRLCPMNTLYLPGGFEDPAGITNLIDTSKVSGLFDFLRSLGIRELTFVDYARRFLPKAFANGSPLSASVKRELISILEVRLSDLKVNDDIKASLAQTNIVECTDGKFRKPQEVYFSYNNIKDLFGPHASYARVPQSSESRHDLYNWLGVATRPRPRHVIELVKDTVRQPPSRSKRLTIQRVVQALGAVMSSPTAAHERAYRVLRELRWLPAEGDLSTWRVPSELYSTHFKHLFESQATFIDISQQHQSSELMGYLGVNGSPEPYQVARHLLKCARDDEEPPGGVYHWLNERAQPGHLSILHDKPCLRVDGKWLRPNQVFWAKHSFGRFRLQLGGDFRQYQKLLSALNVKEDPDYYDAIEVLKEVGRLEDTRRLHAPYKTIILQCWTILADTLGGEVIDTGSIKSSLRDVRCVPSPRPNDEETLDLPSLVFFDDGYGGNFDLIKWNLIPRLEHIWTAMEAAGVRPLGDVVQADIHEARNRRDDAQFKELVESRMALIKAVLQKSVALSTVDGSIKSLRNVQFQASDELTVELTLEVFSRSETVKISEDAFFDHSNSVLYFSLRNEKRPWSAIARELTRAIAPGEDTVVLVPVLKTILEAVDRDSALAELRDFGIQVPEEMTVAEGGGYVAEQLEEASNGDDDPQDDPAASAPGQPQNGATPTDVASEPSQEAEPCQVEQPQVTEEVDDQTGDVRQPEQATPFAELFFGVQEPNPRIASESPANLPEGGPQTEKSARSDKEQSERFGRLGSRVQRPRIRWEPTRASANLENKFRNMTRSDYVERCQICGNTFKKRAGEDWQIFVVHMVRPSSDDRTNNYGNLLALCGWHYALIQYGQFEFLDPKTAQPFEDSEKSTGWECMQEFILNVCEEDYNEDEVGNHYVGLPVQFWNVYEEWSGSPDTMRGEIRYCLPHWT